MMYYCEDKKSGLLIEPNDSFDASLCDILEARTEMSGFPNSFFGVTNRVGETMQFYWEEDGQITLDIPLPQLGGSRQKKVSNETGLITLKRFLQTDELPTDHELTFVSW